MEFNISNVLDTNNPDVQDMQEFLSNFFGQFAKETLSFHNHWGMLPFTYSEKQVNSVVVPAMYNITGNIWLEQPYKAGTEQRFLDIATVHGNNIYLIELKHAWNSKNENIAENADGKWKTAIEQIADLKRSTVKQFVNHKDFNIFRIALMIMPTYLTNNFDHNILKKTSKEYAESIFNKYQNIYWQKKYCANYVSTWKIEDYENYAHEYDRGKQIFPFISFIARVEKVFD